MGDAVVGPAPLFGPRARVVGIAAAWTTFAIDEVYAVLSGIAFLREGTAVESGPLLSVMAGLVVVMGPFLVLSMVAVQAFADPSRWIYGLAALGFMVACVTVTSCVNFLLLLVSSSPELFSESWRALFLPCRWPAPAFVLDIFVWDWFFGVSMLLAAPIFGGDALRRGLRFLMVAGGILCLAGIAWLGLSGSGHHHRHPRLGRRRTARLRPARQCLHANPSAAFQPSTHTGSIDGVLLAQDFRNCLCSRRTHQRRMEAGRSQHRLRQSPALAVPPPARTKTDHRAPPRMALPDLIIDRDRIGPACGGSRFETDWKGIAQRADQMSRNLGGQSLPDIKRDGCHRDRGSAPVLSRDRAAIRKVVDGTDRNRCAELDDNTVPAKGVRYDLPRE